MSNFDPTPMIIHGKNPYSQINPDKQTLSIKTV